MKVLHITTTDNGGAGLCCLRIHQALLQMGVESKVVSLCNTQFVQEEYEYGRFNEKIARIPSKLLRMIGLSLTNRNKIIDLYKEKHLAYSLPISSINLLKCEWIEWADIIHLHWVNNYLDYPSFFRGINKPIVWTLHDENFFYGIAHYSESVLLNNSLENHFYEIKKKSLAYLKNLNVVLLSEFMLNKFGKHEFLKCCKVNVINNPVNAKEFKPISKELARNYLGLSKDDILIAFTALTISESRKGLTILSQAVLRFGNPKIKILAIGNNPNKLVLPNMIEMGPIVDVNKMSIILSAADCYAMPSFQEAFAQSPMEALACGLPVVMFPVSGASELINVENGIVCEHFTVDSLYEGLKTVMNHKYNANMIREDVIARFSSETIAQKYMRLYKDIIST